MILGHPLLRRNVAEHRRGPSRAFRLLRRTPPDGYYPTILLSYYPTILLSYYPTI
jgi:hypothetical protein